MERDKRTIAAAGIAWLAVGVFYLLLLHQFQDPFPPLSVSLSTPTTQLNDFIGIALGIRRLTADIAWIQTLQYYGTEEANQSEEEFENGIGKYPLFLAYCQRVARIDPYFTYVYFYGGGALGWNMNRLDEAEILLKEGIAFNPTEWRLQQYLAALAYQKNHDLSKLTLFLESFVQEEDCPSLLRALLANIYKKQGRYEDAIKIWTLVYQTGDAAYRERAVDQIHRISALAARRGRQAP